MTIVPIPPPNIQDFSGLKPAAADREVFDGHYDEWFETDNVSVNLRTNIASIYKYIPVPVQQPTGA
jgi:hypothetical protein